MQKCLKSDNTNKSKLFQVMNFEKLYQEIHESVLKYVSDKTLSTNCTSWYTGSATLAIDLVDWATKNINQIFDKYLPKYHAEWDIWKIYNSDISFSITIYKGNDKLDYFLIEVMDKIALADICKKIKSIDELIRHDFLTSCLIDVYRILYLPLMKRLVKLYRSKHFYLLSNQSTYMRAISISTENIATYREEHKIELMEYLESLPEKEMTDQLAAEYRQDMEILHPIYQDVENLCYIIRQHIIKVRPEIQKYSQMTNTLVKRLLGMGESYMYIVPQVCGVEYYDTYDNDTSWLCDPLAHNYCEEYHPQTSKKYISVNN